MPASTNDHPIKALGDYLCKLPHKPLSRAEVERLKQASRRAFIGEVITNINSLDRNDARGVEDVIDRDKLQAKQDGELIETNGITTDD